MDKLDTVLRVRIKKKDVDELKIRCKKLNLKYTNIIRGMIKLLNEKASDERLRFLGS